MEMSSYSFNELNVLLCAYGFLCVNWQKKKQKQKQKTKNKKNKNRENNYDKINNAQLLTIL